ncbi:hypothetical protein BD310DRAFT_40536 [Dichomitus squalens]|uniref:Uncharacterized protein n=1 Tax=Dichomitus squalens TaxID=114155 RepID=A0A4Q9QGK5_9APHY|nr:hypothetical protein BD310DRAFT_40536 [Dichomitus squalens]
MMPSANNACRSPSLRRERASAGLDQRRRAGIQTFAPTPWSFEICGSSDRHDRHMRTLALGCATADSLVHVCTNVRTMCACCDVVLRRRRNPPSRSVSGTFLWLDATSIATVRSAGTPFVLHERRACLTMACFASDNYGERPYAHTQQDKRTPRMLLNTDGKFLPNPTGMSYNERSDVLVQQT